MPENETENLSNRQELSKSAKVYYIYVVEKSKSFIVAESDYFVDKSRNLFKINSSKRGKSRRVLEKFGLFVES